jgi:hypothetical protein
VALPAVFDVELVGESAFVGAFKTPEDGVYGAAAVVAFEPPDTELEAANEVEAPAPVAPEDAFA